MRVLTALRPVAAALAIAALGCSDYLAVPCRATDAKPVVFRNPDAQSRESFYVPPSPLPDGKPGDVIWAEAIDAPKGANAWKVLYLSRSADMEPIAVSGWVVAPKPGGAERPKPVVAWAHGTTGLADECAPTQRRLDEPTVTNLAAIPMLSELIAAGYVVAATDYEGLGTPGLHTYGVSDSEARTVLDSIRAAGKMPTGAGSRALVFGESQGGRVAVVVNEMASDYAPEIELVGVVSSGTAVPLSPDRHAQFMVESGKGGVLMMGLAVQFETQGLLGRTGARAYLTELGISELKNTQVGCVFDVLEHFAKFEPYALFKEKFVTTTNVLSRWGEAPGNRKGVAPLLLVHGLNDDFVPAEELVAWKEKACRLGQQVELNVYPQSGHVTWEHSSRDVMRWVSERFAGRPLGLLA